MQNKSKKNLIIGILGGMGPYATLAFFEKILKLTPTKKDWDHLHLVIDNNPHIPSRNMAYLGIGESPVEAMIESCKQLEHYPVDLIVLPCNSATYYLPRVQKHIKIPILSIVEITSQRIGERFKPGTRIAVWGAAINYVEKIYQVPLEKQGFVYLNHSEEEQKVIASFIEYIKRNGKIDPTAYKKFLADYIKKYTPDIIILGCTEFGCLIGLSSYSDIALIDSSAELANHVVELALKYKNEH